MRNQVSKDGMEGEYRENCWSWWIFGGWYENLVQWKLPGIYEGDQNENPGNGGYDTSPDHLLRVRQDFQWRD